MSRALVGPRVSRPTNPRRRFALQFLAIAVGGQACASTRIPPTDSALKRSQCEAASIETRRGFQGATLADALQGQVPGLNIVQTGGAGGGGFLSIRGSNSLYSGQPLIYLDGIRMTQITSTGPGGVHSLPLFEYVNVADIDRIEVLRGPAATIQYGSDAADGVIRIFTRQGRGDESTETDSADRCGSPVADTALADTTDLR